MLTKIHIEKLFNKFTYDIELKKEGITILTGPNGYGKTTILKIIHALAIKNIPFFFQLPFTKIIITQEEMKISLIKTKHELLKINWGDRDSIIHRDVLFKEIHQLIEVNSAFRPSEDETWTDRRTGIRVSTEILMNQFFENTPGVLDKFFIRQVPDFIDVYLIREQRLIRKFTSFGKRRSSSYYIDDEMREGISNTIETYAEELSKEIKNILANASKIGQELDSSFPSRLFDETKRVSESEFNTRYGAIKEKQKLLSTYGLSAIKEEKHTSFKDENANALRVYLHDTEKKLAVFDEILQKLQLFSTILNERRFVNKKLEISPDFGFRFIAENKKELPLTALSSGEQQEVVLLYELLFRVTPNTLVLIDEPEISLHVAWQKEVLNDLLKIIELKKISVITATHSPQIIGPRWDLVVDLADITK